MDSIYVRQPASPSKTRAYWFYASVEVSVAIALLSECAGSMLPGLAVILHSKYDKTVYIIINLFIFISKKSLFLERVDLQDPLWSGPL